MLVVHRQLRQHAVLNDAGTKRARRVAAHLAAEQELDSIGATEVEILAQQLLEDDAAITKLALRPLVPVETHAHGEGGVGRKLDEAGTEVAIEDVEVVVIDEALGAVEIESHPAVPRAAFDRAE